MRVGRTERDDVGESHIPSSEERRPRRVDEARITVHEIAVAVNGQIITEDGDYDHRRLTTIYTDNDLPEPDASSQPGHFTGPPWNANARAKHRKFH
jgi:hypothetical protein